jgi:hypothetical protein
MSERENIFTRIFAMSDKKKQNATNFTQSSFISLHNHSQHHTLPCRDNPPGIVTSSSPNLIPITVPLTPSHQTAAVQSGIAQVGT